MEGYIQQRKIEMLQLIEKLVNIDSGSYVKKGIDEIGRILQKKYEEIGFVVEVKTEAKYGNHLVIRHEHSLHPKIILVAHMDTVFPEGTVKKRPFQMKGSRAYGPGVVDMKSSLVELLYAMKALVHCGSNACENVQIILNGDEEIGSPSSRELIEEQSMGKEYALIMEPARKDGSLVTARRGGGRYKLMIKGKAAHSGIEPEKGRSAIEELAYKIIQLHNLTNHEQGISVNVGIISGGSSVNTISDNAVAHIDIRITEKEQAQELEKKIKRICANTEVRGTEIQLEGAISRPPMEYNEQTEKLLHIIQEVGEEIGLHVHNTATGGGGDASFTSATGVPTVDGLGPVGGNAHSKEEYIEIDTLTERTILLAKTIERLSR
ncbi:MULTISPECIES: M20 family metallopeptidase [Cytobacillus]|uniref:M20 family metallopeptidase n=1 Tax=Cytobacillus TaxID=2675230 RepID=UPI001CD2F428|nr:M20 family metallopeptidase [Cytobacillus kochii]MCA1024512.1 M20 family metallopeptidase [Cytobacillus kochii]MCM3323501.1 M20 family metallopeptidase [Cytobacillus kochii]MCM3345896.1 M20 family metallopeptidase [Cytobacillus kochii]